MSFRGAMSLRGAGWIILAAVFGCFLPALGQSLTSPEQCALDSLMLLSPAENGLHVQLAAPGMRFGTYVQWAELDDAEATCAAIVGADELPFSVEVSGSYQDDVDRAIQFFTLDSGEVGTQTRNRLLFRWTNFYVGRSGRVQGEFNISNSGGLLRYDPDDGSWQRVNAGLPQYLAYTNILAYAQSFQNSEHMVLHIGGGSPPPGSDPRGLWERTGAFGWQRVAPDIFPDGRRITRLAFSPLADGSYAVGTLRDGFYVTQNGGQSFQLYGRTLAANPPANLEVTALTWDGNGRLYAAIRAFGLFMSTNGGNPPFSALSGLKVPYSATRPDSLVFPYVQSLVFDPGNSNHLLAAIKKYALCHSLDGGVSWSLLGGDWTSLAVNYDGRSVAVSPFASQIIIVGTENAGLWRTSNGGTNWQRVGVDLAPGGVWTGRPVVGIVFDPNTTDRVFAHVDGLGLLRSTDAGVTWALTPQQPTNRLALGLAPSRDGSSRLMLPTYGGGIYTPGTPVEISRTINRGTSDPAYHNLQLGLSIAFSEGVVDSGTVFLLKCQDFQGYAVWRSTSTNPFDMQLIGVYDKTNPETCIEGFCGDANFTIIPGCFSEKRAACFDFTSKADSVVFFDNNVYNGFTYYYAVTSFDYGNTAGVEPPALTSDQLFSPRWPSTVSRRLNPDLPDPATPFFGEGNMVAFEVNLNVAGPLDGPEIYVFPNPLRRDLGFPGQEGDKVVFTNLPAGSTVRVFTADGDLVVELGPERQVGSNLPWVTKADDGRGEPLASGIYIWKVEMPQRGDFWGKLVIIR
jgi:hypothetical protein